MKGFRSLFLTFLPLGAEAAFNRPVFAINLTLVLTYLPTDSVCSRPGPYLTVV